MLNCMPAMNSLRNKPNEMPLRFTIRDLLWLILAIALFLRLVVHLGFHSNQRLFSALGQRWFFHQRQLGASRNRDLSDAIWRSLYLAVRDRI